MTALFQKVQHCAALLREPEAFLPTRDAPLFSTFGHFSRPKLSRTEPPFHPSQSHQIGSSGLSSLTGEHARAFHWSPVSLNRHITLDSTHSLLSHCDLKLKRDRLDKAPWSITPPSFRHTTSSFDIHLIKSSNRIGTPDYANWRDPFSLSLSPFQHHPHLTSWPHPPLCLHSSTQILGTSATAAHHSCFKRKHHGRYCQHSTHALSVPLKARS